MKSGRSIRNLEFEPSGERGQRLDATMRGRLAQSLGYIFDRIGPDLGVPCDDTARIVDAIRSRRQSPQLFGAYYDLVLAVERDQIEPARQLAAEIHAGCDAPAPRHWAASLSDRPSSDLERYRRLLLPDEIRAEAPSQEALDDALVRIEAAMTLLDRGFPEMAAEIRALLREVVIAVGPSERGAMTFDGSSSYMLWGTTMLNARGQSTVLDTAQALAHESGHNLLFGMCANGPLIENDDDEAFAHPLRQDARPMDGVFHAAYVIARMHQTVERLLEADVLDTGQSEAARADLELHRRNFEAADEVIRSAGKLTTVGAAAIAAARAHLCETV